MAGYNSIFADNKGGGGTAPYQTYDSIFLKKSDLAKKRKQDRVNYFNNLAAQADAERERVHNQSLFSKFKQYAPGVIADEAKGAASSIAAPFVYAGKKGANLVGDIVHHEKRGPGAAELLRRQDKAAARDLPQDIQDKAKQISSGSSIKLLALIDKGASNEKLRGFLDKAVKEKKDEDLKALGTTLQIGSTFVGGGSLPSVARAGAGGFVKAAVPVVASGAAGGVGNTLATNPSADKGEILRNALIGGGAALAFAGGASALGAGLRRGRGVRQPELNETGPVGASAAGMGTQDLRTPVVSTSANIAPRSTGYNSIFEGSVPMAAQRTEKVAIEKGLADGFDLKATPNMNLAEQADKAYNLINDNYDAAKKIALGEVNAPGNLQPSAVYKAIEQKAAREGDAVTLHELATKSKIPGVGKQYGQFNAAFAFKDPESPLTAMEKIIKARKDSPNPNYPKDLNPQEADTLTRMAKDVADKKAAIADGGDRFAYGNARVAYDNYVNELVAAANKGSFKSLSNAQKLKKIGVETASTAKSLKASLDLSRILRQDWKTVFSHPTIWAKNSAKSFKDAVDQFGGKEVMDGVRADVLSRPNADLYASMEKASGMDLFSLRREELLPSSLPEKVPGFGRIYKASEAGFNAGQLRERADLTDLYANIFKNSYGKDLTDKKFLSDFAEFIGDLTSRGKIKNPGRADLYNKVLFAPRNLKANVRFLTSELGRNADPAIKAEAAKNLLKTVVGTGIVLGVASSRLPGSVDKDPRSSNFGKITVGNTRFDVSGGMASLITLASRLVPTRHNGEWGLWRKDSTSKQFSNMWDKKYGASNGLDTLVNFAEGKASPPAAVILDYLKGETFGGDKPTLGNELSNAFTPLVFTNYNELRKDPRSANKLLAMIADGLGIGTNTYSGMRDWSKVDTKTIQGFKAKVTPQQFSEANKQFNDEYSSWLDRISKDSAFKSLSDENKQKLITNKKRTLTADVLKRYGYQYKSQSNPSNNVINNLLRY